MTETILVATDGSDGGHSAERMAIHLASRLRLRLAGITVIEDSSVRSPGELGSPLPPYPEAELSSYYRARAEAVSAHFSETTRAAGVDANCEIAQGRADDRIVDKAQGSDMLALGRDGQPAGRNSALVGSTTESVIRKTSKSTLVAPSGARTAGPIVLGFDGSPGSRLAAAATVELANGLNEAVHVFVDSKDKGRAAARFEEARQLLGGLMAPPRETSSTLGRPDVKLVDTAREAQASLIVMGAFGRNRITDYFLGSNAAAVVRTTPISVLLVR